MAADTIDHGTLSRLVQAGAVRAAQVVGQAGGWALSFKYGVAEQSLAAQRSGKLRLFRKLETVVDYLKGLGISRFEVDASAYDAATAKSRPKRPDRAEALRTAHAAAERDRWFREQVRLGLEEAEAPGAALTPHEEIRERWAEKRARLLAQAEGDDSSRTNTTPGNHP
jgi:hypothetical protein